MLPVLSALFIILKIIIAFSLLILIHEFGHFIVAKKSGVWVVEFGLGLPPRIFGKKIGETIYSINALPIGGFVKLHGETYGEEVKYPDRAFTKKSKLTKIAITLAGIVMNFVLAVICFGILFFVTGIPGKNDLVITDISANSPAQKAQIMKKDVIQKINGKEVVSDQEFITEIQNNKGKEISLVVKRNNELISFNLTPRENPPAGEGALGVSFVQIQETYYPPLVERPFVSAWWGIKQTADISKAVVFGLGSTAQTVSTGQAPKDLHGIVDIIAIMKRIAELGTLQLIAYIGLFSVNLAIVNIIPFPPLDGSRIALVIVEWITRKKMSAKLEERIYLIGFIVLIGLTILMTTKELPALIRSGSLDNYADQILNQSQK
jgi:regulator of sigma E protease